MKNISEDGMISGAPTNNTGSNSSTAGLSSKSSKMAGYDPLIKFKRNKRKVDEENLDTNTLKSRQRFKKKSIPVPDEKPEVSTEITRYHENKTFKTFTKLCEQKIKHNLNEDVFDKLYKISNEKFPQRVIFADRSITYVDPETAFFIVKTIQQLSPELQKLFRQMMNRNIIAFMRAITTLRRNKE